MHTVGQICQLQISQLQEVVLLFQQAIVGLHIVVNDVQGMQLLQPLRYNSVLVSNIYLTDWLSGMLGESETHNQQEQSCISS